MRLLQNSELKSEASLTHLNCALSCPNVDSEEECGTTLVAEIDSNLM